MPRGYCDWVEWETKELVQLVHIFQSRGDRIRWKRIALKMKHRRVEQLMGRFISLKKRFGPDTSRFPARFFEPYVRPRGRHMRAQCEDKRMAAEQLKDPAIKARLDARREKAQTVMRERQRRAAAELRRRAADEELDDLPLSRLVRRTRELAADEEAFLSRQQQRDERREERKRLAKLQEERENGGMEASEENEQEQDEGSEQGDEDSEEDVGFEAVDESASDDGAGFRGVDEDE